MRDYNRYYLNGVLSTWIQRRCEVCQRFLAKKQQRFCSIHGSKEFQDKRYVVSHLDVIIPKLKEYRENHREEQNLRNFVYKHIDEINIGDYV